MQVAVSTSDGYVVAKTNGHIEDDAREAFREQLHPLVAERGTRLIVDLSGSPRVNSQGLGHMVTLVAHANTNASRVIFCAPPPFVSVVLSVTKLDRFFELAESVDEAAGRFAQLDAQTVRP